MKARTLLVLSLLSVGMSLPAFAGDGQPCPKPAEECVEAMIAKLSGRGWVGIEMDKTEDGHWLLTNVVPRSPANEAGLQKGDLLVAMNGLDFAMESPELKKAHQGMKPGNEVIYTVRRDGTERKITVVLGKLPKALLAQWIGYHMIEGHSGTAARVADEDD